MPNDITAFFELLTAAAGTFNAAKVGTTSFLDGVYKNVRPQVARRGQKIRIPFPDSDALEDVGNNDWTLDEHDTNYVDVEISKRPGKGVILRDFEAIQTEADVLELLLDPLYKRALEFANAEIAALMNTNTGNFDVNPVIQSAGVGTLNKADIAAAWDTLVDAKVPITGPADASLIVHNNVHGNMMQADEFTKEDIVGAVIAAQTFQDAGASGLANYQFRRYWDQQAPYTLTTLTGTVGATNGSTALTGSSTAFTTELKVGSVIQIGTDPAIYRIRSITSDTAAVLVQQYAGVTGTGKAGKKRTYTSVAMHRNAIALVMRPLELVNEGNVTSRLIMLKDIPVRVQYSYQHLKGGRVLTLDYAMGAKVIRPDHGVLIKS